MKVKKKHTHCRNEKATEMHKDKPWCIIHGSRNNCSKCVSVLHFCFILFWSKVSLRRPLLVLHSQSSCLRPPLP